MPSNRERVRITVRDACELVGELVAPEVRRQMLDSVRSPDGFQTSLARLRRAMRSHTFASNGGTHSLARVVQALDHRTKSEGFHVLESWNYVEHKFADQIVPVLMLDRCAATDSGEPGDDGGAALSVLLDQYFLSVLGLLVVRAWDDPDPDAVFDEVTRLLGMLGDPSQRFVDDAATLLLLAVSHYHPHEAAYDRLVDRIATLGERHRLSFALACAPVLSGHFRWGLRFMYQRDFGRLRDDNVVDYPWLLLSMVTLAEAYCRSATSLDRPAIVEGLLSGLSADPWLFVGKTPACLRGREREHELVRAAIQQQRDSLLAEFEAIRPLPKVYSPLGFEVNFLCNALVAMVATAVDRGGPHPSLNALLATEQAREVPRDERERYARSLMDYASGGTSGAAALIVYDPHDAQSAYNLVTQVLAGV